MEMATPWRRLGLAVEQRADPQIVAKLEIRESLGPAGTDRLPSRRWPTGRTQSGAEIKIYWGCERVLLIRSLSSRR